MLVVVDVFVLLLVVVMLVCLCAKLIIQTERMIVRLVLEIAAHILMLVVDKSGVVPFVWSLLREHILIMLALQ